MSNALPGLGALALFPNALKTPTQRDTSAAPEVAGLRVQTSIYGRPVPIVYGTARIAGNVLHYKDFLQLANITLANTGGKWGVDMEKKSYVYQAAVALGLCEGPITLVGRIWRDKDASGTWSIYSAAGFLLFTGTLTQTPWGYLTSFYPGEAVPYQGTAYVAHPTWPLADGGVLPNYSWEVRGFLPFGGPGSVVDASPKDIIVDFLTDANHGAGFPSAQLGSWTDFGKYCAAAGLFCSPTFENARPAADCLSDLFAIGNSAPVWSDGLLKVVPYGDTALTGNGQTFTPNVAPAYALTEADFKPADGEDPVVITRGTQADAFNQVQISHEDRSKDYTTGIQEAKDQASIDLFGLRPAPVAAFPWVKDPVVARALAQLRLQRATYVRNQYAFRLGWKYALLEPMDIVTLTEPGLGLAAVAVRLTAVEEDGDEFISCTAEDFPAGNGTAPLYGSGSSAGPAPDTGVDPGNATVRVVQAPAALANAPIELWIGAAGGTDWGGCDVYFSTDGTSYALLGSINRPAVFGTLTAALATGVAAPATDGANTLKVDLTPSRGVLASATAADLTNYLPLCYVDGEWLAFQTVALTATYKYDITILKRGLYGSTIPASHANGSAFLRADTALFRFPYPQGIAGQTVYFKCPSFNRYGGALQSLASVSPVTYTIPNAASAPNSAPTALVVPVPGSLTDTQETVTLTGLLAPFQQGPLNYRYRVDVGSAVGTWSGVAAYPGGGATLVVNRDVYAVSTVVLEIIDAGTGQLSRATYAVASQGETRAGRGFNGNSRLTDQRNARAIVSANLSAAIVGGTPLTCMNPGGVGGVVGIAAFTMQYGFGQVNYNAGTVNNFSVAGTVLYVYCSDPGLAGGAVTYGASAAPESPQANSDRVYLGKVTVPASGGSNGGSGGGGYV